MPNLLTKDGANQDRYILADGSGTASDPTILRHGAMLYNATGSALGASTGSPLGTELALIVRTIPSGTQTIQVSGAQDVKQTTASALNATVVGAVEVRQSLASALRATAEIYQAAASALNATVTGSLEVRQSNASALRATAEVYQAAPSALRATAEIYQGTASALNATVVGAVEVRQSNASALQVTAEVRQATASALQATVTQSPTASGWTARLVTNTGDNAMDNATSALRVNLVAGGAGNGHIQDGVQSNLAATVVGYAAASPLTVRLTDTDGNYVAAGAGTQYTEDAAAAANPVGGVIIGRRRDALGSETTTDGDNVAINATDKGELYVKHVDAIPVTDNGGVLTVDGTVSVSANNLNVRIQDSAGILLQGGASDPVNTDRALIVRNIPSGSQAVTGSVGITGVVDVRQASGSALNATVAGAVEARQSNASAMQVTAEVRQATASALNAQVVGNIAHDGVDSGNPLKIGGIAREASPTNVSPLDRADAYFDKAGRLMTRTANQGQDSWTATCKPGNTNIRANAIRAANGSGIRNVCTGLNVTLGGGSAAPAASYMDVELLDGPSGTNVLWGATLSIPATAGAMTGIRLNGLWIKSSQASALALQFQSPGGANTVQSVSMEGTTIVE